MQLNEDQTNALNKIIVFLAQPSKKDLVLDSPAGCGKGYLLNYIHEHKSYISDKVRLLHDKFNNNFIFTSTTNESLSVLPDSAVTIYSFAGLRPIPNKESFFKFKSKSPSNLVIFVDEASYISSNAHKEIREQLPNAKIIWVMDEYQLTNVHEKKAYVATLGFPKITLSKVMRNTGYIQDVSLLLREAVKNEQYVDLKKYANGKEVELLSPFEFDTKICEEFSIKDDVKYLGYTNASVSGYNNAIHQRVFRNPPFPHKGAVGIINKYNDNIHLRCGTKVHIERVETSLVHLTHNLTVEETHLYTNKGHLIMCNDKVPKNVYNPNRYYYSDVVLPYGSTVHKSQGQSINTVFIDLPNIESCRDSEMVRRLKYVGWSRGIEKIYLKDVSCINLIK